MGIKDFVKRTPLMVPFIAVKSLMTRPKSQNEEAEIIAALVRKYKIPRSFIEFGFSGWEFNCASLIRDWDGLLVDGDPYNIKIGKIVYPSNIVVKHLWLTLDTLPAVAKFAESRELGILSIDVDGNDYWFLQALIYLKPAMIIAEYNSFFGTEPVCAEYDPGFDRFRKSPRATYFGASLTALSHLTFSNGYQLVAVTPSGVNAFFLRNDVLGNDAGLDPIAAFREQDIPARIITPEEARRGMQHLPKVDVTKLPAGEVRAVSS